MRPARQPTPLILSFTALSLVWPTLATACPGGSGTIVRPNSSATERREMNDNAPAAAAIPGPWTFPRSLEALSRYNSECRPSLSADGTVLVFEASASNGTIHRSVNGGITWLPIAPDFGTHVSVGAAADCFRDSRGTLWAMGWGHGVGAYVMRHTGGIDWEVDGPFQRGSEYNDSFVFEMVENDRGWLYVGMQPSGGSPAWISMDGGLSWNPTSAMEGAKEMLALLHTQDGRVLAGTSGDGGIWEWELSAIVAPPPGPAAVSGARGRRAVARGRSRR